MTWMLACLALVAGVVVVKSRFRRDPPRPVPEPTRAPPAGKGASAAIDAFWAWWPAFAPRLASAFETGTAHALVGELTEKVHAIDARLAWDTGPGLAGARHHFALSAEGDIALRVITERWLARAPAADATWEFYAARQPSRRLEGQAIRVTGDDAVDFARVQLGLRTDGMRERVHVELHHPAFARLDEQQRQLAAMLVLDKTLGEDEVERWIGHIAPSGSAPPEPRRLDELVEEVKALARSSTRENFAIVEGRRDGHPVVATFNFALKRVDHLLMEQHLAVSIALEDPTPAGLVTNAEAATLNALEDELLDQLGHDVVYIGRETGLGVRTIHLHAAPTGPVQARAEAWMRRHPRRRITVDVAHDPAWTILDRW